MRSTRVQTLAALSIVLSLTAAMRGQQAQRPDPAKALSGQLRAITKQVLDMAEDFPAEKYAFKPTPEVRSFGEVIVHAMSGTVYAARAGAGENVKWTELDPKDYKDKSAIVEAFRKAASD